tara:strand:+ start:1607 stop:1963 length:357 start_codon:yes stop_codon:yes gene_type:complete
LFVFNLINGVLPSTYGGSGSDISPTRILQQFLETLFPVALLMRSFCIMKLKKYFDPRDDTLYSWDSDLEVWKVMPLDSDNIDEFFFLRDYIEAECKIETLIEAQKFFNEGNRKKDLHE